MQRVADAVVDLVHVDRAEAGGDVGDEALKPEVLAGGRRQAGFEVEALRDVDQRNRHVAMAVLDVAVQADLERQNHAVLAHAADDAIGSHAPAVIHRPELGAKLGVRKVRLLRQQFGDRLTDQFVGVVAEDHLGVAVRGEDRSRLAEDDQAVRKLLHREAGDALNHVVALRGHG